MRQDAPASSLGSYDGCGWAQIGGASAPLRNASLLPASPKGRGPPRRHQHLGPRKAASRATRPTAPWTRRRTRRYRAQGRQRVIAGHSLHVDLTGQQQHKRRGSSNLVCGRTRAPRPAEVRTAGAGSAKVSSRGRSSQAHWPEAKIKAADLPLPLAQELTVKGESPSALTPTDALWHVSPVGTSRPGVAVAWTYQITGSDSLVSLTAIPLARPDRSLVRFTGATPVEAVRAGYDVMAERGLAADATRRMPRNVLDLAQKESIRLATRRDAERELRPDDPFEVYSRLSTVERRRALQAVPEEARSLVEAPKPLQFGLHRLDFFVRRNRSSRQIITSVAPPAT